MATRTYSRHIVTRKSPAEVYQIYAEWLYIRLSYQTCKAIITVLDVCLWIIFFIKSLKQPSPSFDITKWVKFNSSVTRSSTHLKLVHTRTKCNLSHHYYFNRLPRLWNALPPLELSLSIDALRAKLFSIILFWSFFNDHFNKQNPCSLHVVCPCSKCDLTPISLIVLINLGAGRPYQHTSCSRYAVFFGCYCMCIHACIYCTCSKISNK